MGVLKSIFAPYKGFEGMIWCLGLKIFCSSYYSFLITLFIFIQLIHSPKEDLIAYKNITPSNTALYVPIPFLILLLKIRLVLLLKRILSFPLYVSLTAARCIINNRITQFNSYLMIDGRSNNRSRSTIIRKTQSQINFLGQKMNAVIQQLEDRAGIQYLR